MIVVSQLSALLVHDLTIGGAAETLFLLLVAWWAWLNTTWATNWFDPERGPVRGVLVVAMLAIARAGGAYVDPHELLRALL